MIVLALDTALGACQGALLDTAAPERAAVRSLATQKGQSERLVGLVDEVLADAGVRFAELDRVAVTVGPGSFTGIRVALAYARGLCVVLKTPALGIGTLEAFAAEAAAIPSSGRGPIAAAVDARHGAVYGQLFDGLGRAVSGPARVSVSEFARSVPEGATVIGDAAEALAGALAALRRPPAAVLARSAPDILALARLAAERPASDGRPAPLYLREADAAPQAHRRVALS